jgi:hypothetical protein
MYVLSGGENMKKIVFIIFTIFITITTSAYTPNTKILVNNNCIQVDYPNNEKIKLVISKDMSYTYDVNSSEDKFPLQMGKGKYKIKIFKNIKEDIYRLTYMQNIIVENNENIFLQSIQNINWDNNMSAIQKAHEINNRFSINDTIDKIYYMILNMDYDLEKAKNVQYGYIPNIEETYIQRKGICYDKASLFAAMLRSINIPTKMVTGYYDNGSYHAWNEVYINNKWIIVDTTKNTHINDQDKIKIKNYIKIKEY